MRKNRSRSMSNQRGASAVELAFIAPLLFLFLFGIIQYGFVFNRKISVTHAAREGARQLSLAVAPASAETNAEATSPNVAGSVMNCTAQPNSTDSSGGTTVEMLCVAPTSVYRFFGLVPVPDQVTSIAKMRRE